jgi:hypothetical protein
MPLALDKVHEYQKIPGTSEVRLIRTQPYVRLTHENWPPIFIQGGQFYYQGGPPVTPLPEWVAEEVARLSPACRAEVGLEVDRPVSEPKPKLKPPRIPQAAPWTCPQCGKAMGQRGKSFHELHHKKQAEKAAAAEA